MLFGVGHPRPKPQHAISHASLSRTYHHSRPHPPAPFRFPSSLRFIYVHFPLTPRMSKTKGQSAPYANKIRTIKIDIIYIICLTSLLCQWVFSPSKYRLYIKIGYLKVGFVNWLVIFNDLYCTCFQHK